MQGANIHSEILNSLGPFLIMFGQERNWFGEFDDVKKSCNQPSFVLKGGSLLV